MGSMQAFVGVLYASFCSAIIFGKVARAQSIAHVVFTPSIIIRYGKEICPDNLNESESRFFDFETPEENEQDFSRRPRTPSVAKEKVELARTPCPILEFRVVNLLHKEKGGEIMNCKINCVASTLELLSNTDKENTNFPKAHLIPESAKRVPSALLRSISGQSGVGKVPSTLLRSVSGQSSGDRVAGSLIPARGGGSLIQKLNKNIVNFASDRNVNAMDADGEPEGVPFKEKTPMETIFDDKSEQSLEHPFRKEEKMSSQTAAMNESGRIKPVSVDEEPATGPRRVFSFLELETNSHPFFKRIWTVRHVLNKDSPLLSAAARRIIQKNHNLWPVAQCTPDFIRENLDLSQLIVTLSGTAIVSGSSVYCMKVYDSDHLRIGYTFSHILKVDNQGKLDIDLDRLDDLKLQRGGLNPFERKEEETARPRPSLKKGLRSMLSQKFSSMRLPNRGLPGPRRASTGGWLSPDGPSPSQNPSRKDSTFRRSAPSDTSSQPHQNASEKGSAFRRSTPS